MQDILRHRLRLAPLTTAALLASTALVSAQSVLPAGGQVVSGSASIRQSAQGALAVTQASPRAIVNWDSFSVGSSNSVSFAQPSGSAAFLNRVTGATASTIAGSVTGNGQVYLVNPNGIALTPSGSVTVGGGFVASSLDIADGDFNAGRLTFSGTGTAAVSNAGSIRTGEGGFVGLLGGSVSNEGMISAPLGRVGLGSASQATLDLNGDGFLQIALPSSADPQGKPLVDVAGTVRASGGRIELKGATAQKALRDVVNVSGTLSASSARVAGGTIILDGGANGATTVSGRIAARSKAAKGGSIALGGTSIALTGARIAASGATGGGTITIGGGARGTPVPGLTTADRVTVDAASRLGADATRSGDGGAITLWSNRSTDFAGALSARALAGSGDGGAAEISSGGRLGLTGTADLRAASGKTGTLLLDPYDLVISDGTDSNVAGASPFGPTGDTSVLTPATLVAALQTADVTVQTTGTAGSGHGDITVASPISWTTSSSLTLSAAGNIAVNADIRATGGGNLTLWAANGISAGAVTIATQNTGSAGTGNIRLTAQVGSIDLEATTIATNNGDLTITATGVTDGTAITMNAVAMNIGAGTGTITGTSASDTGIYLVNGGNLQASDWTPGFVLTGTGGSTGITIDGGGGNVTFLTGTVAMSGTGTNPGSTGLALSNVAWPQLMGTASTLTLRGSGSTGLSAEDTTVFCSVVPTGTAASLILIGNSTDASNGTGVRLGNVVMAGAVSVSDDAASTAVTAIQLNGVRHIYDVYGGDPASFPASSLTLAPQSSGNVAIASGASVAVDSLTIATSGNGNIINAGAINAASLISMATSGGNIDTTAGTLTLNGDTTTGSGAISLATTGSGTIALGNITYNGSSSGSLTVSTDNGSITAPSAYIASSGGPLNTSLASASGGVDLEFTNISTNNGDLTIKATGVTSGTAITLNNATLSIGSGTGTVIGTSAGDTGIYIGGAPTLAAGSGSPGLTLAGTGGSHGVTIDGQGSDSGPFISGTVTISGTGTGLASTGLSVTGGALIQPDAGTTLTLRGTGSTGLSVADGIVFDGAQTLVGNSAGGTGITLGSVQLIGNITATDDAGSTPAIAIQVTGNVQSFYGASASLILAPQSSGNVAIASGASIAVDSLTIATSGSGSIVNAGAVSAASLISMATSGGNIDTTAGTLTLNGDSSTGSGAISVATTGTGTIALGSVTYNGSATGSLTVSSGSGQITAPGATIASSAGPLGTTIASASGSVDLENTSISTNNGDLTIAATGVTSGMAITLNQVRLNVGTGAGTLTGTSVNDTGIYITGSPTLSAGSGSPGLTLAGTGGTNGVIVDGESVFEGTVTSGTVTISGTGTNPGSTGLLIENLVEFQPDATSTLTLRGTGPTGLSLGAGTILDGRLTLVGNSAGGTGMTFLGTVVIADAVTATDDATSTATTAIQVNHNVHALSGTFAALTLAPHSNGDVVVASNASIAVDSLAISTSGTGSILVAGTIGAPVGAAVPSMLAMTTQAGTIGFTDATIGTNGGTINITAGTPDATPAVSFTRTQVILNGGTISVSGTSASGSDGAITVTSNDASTFTKQYDGLGWSGPTLANAQFDGSVSSPSGASVTGTFQLTAPGVVNAGTYAPTVGGLTGINTTVTTQSAASLVITPAPLTVTASDASKTYDGLAYSGGNGVTYAGFVHGEDAGVLSGSLTYGGTSQGAVNAGTYSVSASGLAAQNYALTYVNGSLTVNRAALTVTANDASKTYDGLAYSGGNGVTYAGFVHGEDAGVLSGSLTYGGSSQGAVNAGTYAITASGLAAQNYALTYVDGSLTVNRAALTISVAAGKTYDGQVWSQDLSAITYAGLRGSDTASALTGTPVFSGTATTAINAGRYDLSVAGLTAGNYNVTYLPGTLTITPAPLTVTASDASKTYDGLAYNGGNGVTYAGFVHGEDAGVLSGSLTYGGSSQGAVNAGTYAITASGLAAQNYALTYVDGSLTVNRAALTVTASDASKTYDGIAYRGGNGVTYAGFVHGETASVLSGLLTYGGTSQGAVNAGTYAISASGLAAQNYALTYVEGELTIRAADGTAYPLISLMISGNLDRSGTGQPTGSPTVSDLAAASLTVSCASSDVGTLLARSQAATVTSGGASQCAAGSGQ